MWNDRGFRCFTIFASVIPAKCHVTKGKLTFDGLVGSLYTSFPASEKSIFTEEQPFHKKEHATWKRNCMATVRVIISFSRIRHWSTYSIVEQRNAPQLWNRYHLHGRLWANTSSDKNERTNDNNPRKALYSWSAWKNLTFLNNYSSYAEKWMKKNW